MLVLRRKVDEAVVLNGAGRVVVLAVEGERVKLGFEADPGVDIVREELLTRSGNVIVRHSGLLVLQRKVDEAVVLNGASRVMVLAVERERVKLGFEADPGVDIAREELLTRSGGFFAKKPVEQGA